MYIVLLKELYYSERKKLEEMWVYKQEAKLRILKARRDALERARDYLSTDELLGRNDIVEEVKENLLRDRTNEEKLRERIEENINRELTEINQEEQREAASARYSAYEYADYLCQQEKVIALETELTNNGLYREEVFREQKLLKEGKE